MNHYISRRGYTIRKENLSPRTSQKIRKDLTVQPYEKQRYMMEKFGNLPPPYKVYLESVSKFYIPKHYGLTFFGEAEDKIGNSGEDIDLLFNGTLRKEQINIMGEFMPNFLKDKGGILNLKTGGGKTALALHIISVVKKKTLVIVHKEFLMNQWVDRIKQFLPDARIGFIQSNKVKIDDCDIVIGMLQSLSQREYPVETFSSFGLNIFDEVHHTSSNVFSRCFPKVGAQFNLGLSATVERKDGTERIINWYLGQTYSPVQKAEFGEVKCFMMPLEDAMYQQTQYNARGNANMPKMINTMVESPKRQKLILDLLIHFHSNGRQTLVLSERLSQLNKLKEELDILNIPCGKCVGGVSKKDLEVTITKPVLLATYSYVAEGFDVSSLNTLIFATPKTDIIQASGRILRQTPEDRQYIPIIVDIVDSTPSMKKKGDIRKRYYKKSKFTIIQTTNVDDCI
tara:strand:- start:2905 stop:4269 length:1365 start_codon:yes stop_codon:yes gene_type:complete